MIIFQNPSDDTIYIKMEAQPDTEVILENLSGKLLVSHITDKKIQDIDLSLFLAGIYFVRIKQSGIIKSKKIIKE